ncbi:MAG: hypothetical protein FJZ15_01050 [Candidatus Omnitrophica bacterium]|nr:hypothetical protein [Candidatus Omnitrophota bacterium]
MRILIGILLVSLFIAPAFADTTGLFGSRGIGDAPPSPRMLAPVKEQIDLTGKDALEFQWSTSDYIGTSEYQFRLYKGYNRNSGNLVFEQDCDGSTGSVEVKASTFEAGQVYTWVVRRITIGGGKSDPVSSSFQITGK